MHKKCAYLFHDPVDYVNLKLTDYLDIIKRPMDLSTLRNNLKKHEYATFSSFLKDAHLIFENCRIYNGKSENGFYYNQADECENAFIECIGKLPNLKFNRTTYNELINN